MQVVNEVGNDQPQNMVKAGKLLHKNDNTDGVWQIASSSRDYQKRIVDLIDLHLGKLGQNEIKQVPSNDWEGFDNWVKTVFHNKLRCVRKFIIQIQYILQDFF